MFKVRALASRLGLGDHRGQGYSQPMSLTDLATQADSPDNITRLRDHDGATVIPEHQEDQRRGLQQTSVTGPFEAASHASLRSRHTTAAQETQQMPHLSPSPSPAPSSTSSTGAESLVPKCDETKNTPRPPVSESLGLWTCAVITGGTILTLGILGFLIFLWGKEEYRHDGGETASLLWRKIMLDKSWPTLSITICTAVLKIITAAQAAVCTSLVAALLLERRRLPLSKAVPVSLKRGISQNPFDFLYGLLSWKSLRPLLWVEMALLLTITIVTFGIQFTSTILLSGFDNTTLVQFPQVRPQHNVSLSQEMFYSQVMGLNSFSKFVPSYALFGELEGTSDIPTPDPHGVSDTGKKLRSFLPLTQQDRLNLRSYKGPALSQDLQVICMRPNISAQISWEPTTHADTIFARSGVSISGAVSYEDTFEEAALDNWEHCSAYQFFDGTSRTDCLPEAFNCSLPLKSSNSPDLLPVSALCHLPLNHTRNFGVSDGTTFFYNASYPLWSASSFPWMFLTLSTNLTRTTVQSEEVDNGISSVDLNTTLPDAGEWRAYEVFPNTTLDISLCFAGLNIKLHNVSMSTATDSKELEAHWNLLQDEDSLAPIQAFMGTNGTKLSLAERGILKTNLSAPDHFTDENGNPSSNALVRGAGEFAVSANHTDDRHGTRYMCNICDSVSVVPPDISALFARTIHTTGRAGWAIQNLLTTYTQSWYAQLLPLFDVGADVEVKYSAQVRIPVHPGGLIAVICIVLVDLVCIWAITVLYVVHTRYSRQGNIWHTVSQIVVSEDTRMVLEQSDRVVLDREVEERLKGDDYMVFIGKPKGSERVSVLRV